jgi:hypothetical protein
MSREVKIGLLTFLVLVTMIWGYTFLKGRNLLSPANELFTTYEDVTDLNVSSPIMVNGYKIGTVTKIKLNPKDVKKMDVFYLIDSDYKIPKNASANLKSLGFVDGKGTSTNRVTYNFEDNNLTNNRYYYRLKQLDFDGSFEYSNEVQININDLNDFQLYQNYPNPFNPSTKIKYTIPTSNSPLLGGTRGGFVTLIVYDVLGNEIARLVNEEQPAGSYEVEFNASSVIGSTTGRLVSGIYFYQLKAGDYYTSRKMLLLK